MKNIVKSKFKRIMIAGTNSGCGKTTITCAVIKALMKKGLKVASFKCGPDYIDPMFHSEIIGTKSRNLDMFLCGENVTKMLFAKNSADCDISVIEGVMGFYDGLEANSISYSSCELSNKTNTPVILVVNCYGMYYSIVALIKGFLEFCKNNIVGVILNNISEETYLEYKETIENNLKIKVLGFMPRDKNIELESRHLGLVTAKEIENLDEKIDYLADLATKNIDLEEIINLAKNSSEFSFEDVKIEEHFNVRIAVAKDNAFCFYYEDSLELLRQMGAELIPFSPLNDTTLPEDIDGLIIGGGYPELYLEQLSKNTAMLNNIKTSVEKGLPTYAECGGFMYLGKTITKDEKTFNVVSSINTNSVLTKKLQNFGYINLEAKEDNMLCKKGQSINAHKFHYSSSDENGSSFKATKYKKLKSWDGIVATNSLFAGYPHLHFWGNIDFARNFLRKCWEFKNMLK